MYLNSHPFLVKKRVRKYMHIRSLIASALLLLGCFHMFGQEIRKEFRIGFPVSNSTLSSSFGNNVTHLSDVISFIESVRKDSTLELVEVSFYGYASPEGRFAINKNLAKNRRNSLERYVREQVLIPDSIISRSEGIFEWERLTELIKESDMPHKEEAIDVLLNEPEYTYNNLGVLTENRKRQLKELQHGQTWRYMHKHFYSQIRSAGVILVLVRQKIAIDEKYVFNRIQVEPTLPEAVAIVKKVSTIEPTPTNPSKPFYMALKTNMLYDVLAIPNIGAEFYLGKNLSISGNWAYAWWRNNDRHRYWRFYGGDLAVRYWFGDKAYEKPLTGHHAGIYGQVFTYDFEWGSKGYMGGEPGKTLWNKTNYAVGIEYGYSLPVANRLNIDFSLGVGYWGGRYHEYTPIDGHHVWKSTKNIHWFGPTKAEITLVWLLGRGNFNNREGGRR